MNYRYKFRPGYKSQNLLIEIFSGAENEFFFADFFNSIVEINPNIDRLTDLWMNDEYLFEINTDIGHFSFSKDIWDYVFISSENNQECLKRIDSILQKDTRFEKIEVNFDDYK